MSRGNIALIIGVSGQDGFYLAKLLCRKKYCVIGVSRDKRRARMTLPEEFAEQIEVVEWDMCNQNVIESILEIYKPSEVYNFAARTSGVGMYDDPVGIGDINGLAVVRLLEALRQKAPMARFCQASSREVFGEAAESPQTELTLRNPRSPYGAAKVYADNMVHIYRHQYGMYACSAILFNHESPRRGVNFVSRKITHEAVKIKIGLSDRLVLGNLEARRDWGFAPDYVYAMWLMLQRESAEDYVIATGKNYSVRDFCDVAFNRLGLNYINYVSEGVESYRSPESFLSVGSSEKAKVQLGWAPVVNFQGLVHIMVDAELRGLV